MVVAGAAVGVCLQTNNASTTPAGPGRLFTPAAAVHLLTLFTCCSPVHPCCCSTVHCCPPSFARLLLTLFTCSPCSPLLLLDCSPCLLLLRFTLFTAVHPVHLFTLFTCSPCSPHLLLLDSAQGCCPPGRGRGDPARPAARRRIVGRLCLRRQVGRGLQPQSLWRIPTAAVR